jgi:salicylate biosynthesis isochorismate synthase/menaquinone-specific isochorismate synthase
MVVPEVSLARADGRTTMTLVALVEPDDDPAAVLARLAGRAEELREEPLPLLDPSPTGRFEVLSAMPPEHYEHAVARATELIREGRMEKIVLAREVQVHAPRAHDPAAVFGVLREEFPSCFVLCAGRGEDALIAASPELLLRREGQRVSTVALAASMRRSADPAVDVHLGEQLLRDPSYREEHAIVARRIERTLRPHSVWVTAAPEPGLAQIANIQHLATPIRAQLAEPIEALELAGIMHPTPAVGGEPLAAAAPLIPALEGLDRGWYLGPLGWTDTAGDGEFCVTLRCALLSGSVARCYAGGGIVRDSVPEKELAETEVKLQALLPLLSG